MRVVIPSMRFLTTKRVVRSHAYVPENDARHLLKNAIVNAKVTCTLEDVDEIECLLAWDIVDEIERGISRREQAAAVDPLEAYCVDNEDADECRLYEL